MTTPCNGMTAAQSRACSHWSRVRHPVRSPPARPRRPAWRCVPDWRLVNKITRAVADRRWGGGVSRSHLASLVGVPRDSREFRAALSIAARLGRVDFADSYVLPGPSPRIPPHGTGPHRDIRRNPSGEGASLLDNPW
jgi:hypothetical protein